SSTRCQPQDPPGRSVTVTEPLDPAEIERLQRRLARERKARLEAEAISERGLRDLYEKQQQLDLLQAIAVAANEAQSLDVALRTALDRVCGYTGWPVGHAYLVATDGSGELVPTSLWHLRDAARFAEFQDSTGATRLARGSGL